jgi:hypothetical protein
MGTERSHGAGGRKGLASRSGRVRCGHRFLPPGGAAAAGWRGAQPPGGGRRPGDRTGHRRRRSARGGRTAARLGPADPASPGGGRVAGYRAGRRRSRAARVGRPGPGRQLHPDASCPRRPTARRHGALCARPPPGLCGCAGHVDGLRVVVAEPAGTGRDRPDAHRLPPPDRGRGGDARPGTGRRLPQVPAANPAADPRHLLAAPSRGGPVPAEPVGKPHGQADGGVSRIREARSPVAPAGPAPRRRRSRVRGAVICHHLREGRDRRRGCGRPGSAGGTAPRG